MPLELSPAVEVTRDADGVVRGLNHVLAPYRGGRRTTPTDLAVAYLRDAAEIFGLDADLVTEALPDAGPDPGDETNRLVLVEEKSLNGVTTLGFAQRLGGLQIWEAGVSVLVQERPPRVLTAQSQYRREVKVDWIDGRRRLDPRKPSPTVLGKLLALGDPKQFGLKINGPGAWWLYRYERARRHDPESQLGEQGGRQGPPSLVLPEVDPRIQEGAHYAVVEVLFRLSVPSWGALNWRAFVEPVTGSVLYIRAFVACATGRVYLTDPTVQTGNLALRASMATTADLDAQRHNLTLPGLDPPTGGMTGTQALRGEFVVIQDTNPPAAAPPTRPSPFAFDDSSPTNDFAAAATYHHVDSAFRLLRNLGFTVATYFDRTTFPVPADHRGMAPVNASCEGNATGDGVGRFRFGPCDVGTTVSMGTEGRTVYHEFGHALLWTQLGRPNFEFAHSAGDSLAMIVTDPHTRITGSDRFIVFTFCPFAPNFGDDRRADRLPAQGWAWGGTRDSGGYSSEEILTTTLFRIYRSLGGDSTRQQLQEFASRYCIYLIVQAIGSLSRSSIAQTLEPDDFARPLMAADAATTSFEGYSGGAMHKVVRWSFEQQGLYQPFGLAGPFITPGTPPENDLYIDDGRNGHYQFRENFWDTTDIWNRRAPDAGLTHEEPVVGQPNFAYVKIRNRGTQPSPTCVVYGYHSRPMTGLIWPADWAPMTTASLPGPTWLAPGSITLVGPFEWTPTTVGHECLLMIVSSPNDPSVVDPQLGTVKGSAIPDWRLVPFDNNIAQRNVAPVSGKSSTRLVQSLKKRVFWISNPLKGNTSSVVSIDVRLPKLLTRLGWDVTVKGVRTTRFKLKRGDTVKVWLVATPGDPITPKLIAAEPEPPRIDVNVEMNGIVVGGMTFPIDPKWTQ